MESLDNVKKKQHQQQLLRDDDDDDDRDAGNQGDTPGSNSAAEELSSIIHKNDNSQDIRKVKSVTYRFVR
jgi:hypothetical protein